MTWTYRAPRLRAQQPSAHAARRQELADPLIQLQRPSEPEIDARLSSLDGSLSYPEAGATANPGSLRALAVSYNVDRHQFSLGSGHDLFEKARSSLFAWRHFDIPWLELHGAKAPPSPGQVVATLTRVSRVWFLNPCRVVYTESPSESPTQAAFAYGTLPSHVESGEERFAVCFDPTTSEVTYEIVVFSRPAILLTRLASPWVRRLQRRFAESSAEALARACRPTRRWG